MKLNRSNRSELRGWTTAGKIERRMCEAFLDCHDDDEDLMDFLMGWENRPDPGKESYCNFECQV
jgi:hypothetical protein